jgi:glucarate dehydratase
VLSDHHYFGGLSGNNLVNGIARNFDIGVGMHSNSHLGVSMAAMVHSAAAMPSLEYACDTHYPWEADDVIQSPFEFEDGRLSVPDDPGLGVEIDESELDRLHDQYQDAELIGSTEAMDRRDPDFEPRTSDPW